MNRGGRILIVFLAFLTLASFRAPQQAQQVDGWVYERDKKGIKIFTRKGKWGKLRDSKAMMTVAATPDQMLKVLTDFNNYKNWMPRCRKSGLVARLSDNEFIVHMVFNGTWPVKDRDCVVRIKYEKDPKTGVITVTETSEPKYIREEADIVRIQQLVSTWKLAPKDGGTEVTNEYSTNPGGNIPDWLVNTQSVDNPFSTFENLQEKSSTRK
jgi:ribosome-associated toxin RatA of RatAB toxin-antitoxin module